MTSFRLENVNFYSHNDRYINWICGYEYFWPALILWFTAHDLRFEAFKICFVFIYHDRISLTMAIKINGQLVECMHRNSKLKTKEHFKSSLNYYVICAHTRKRKKNHAQNAKCIYAVMSMLWRKSIFTLISIRNFECIRFDYSHRKLYVRYVSIAHIQRLSRI